jgi:hypothetical protein
MMDWDARTTFGQATKKGVAFTSTSREMGGFYPPLVSSIGNNEPLRNPHVAASLRDADNC